MFVLFLLDKDGLMSEREDLCLLWLKTSLETY